MKSKKYYIIGIIGLVVLISVFFGIKQIKSNNLDGTYYSYSDYDKEDTKYFDTPKIVIKGDKLTYTSDTEGQGDSSWDLDLKKKTMSYAGEASTPYTIKGDIFSFYGQDYVKEGSETYKNARKK
ncbi:hypothetical protein [Lactococcus formosensis]|uniref:hypothetical protein n=1 Tax=Lactococcus formosensis TaxID=1281486 RepID=UPI001FD56A8A|nr:hypothetical protein [Lactococcus formosensis]